MFVLIAGILASLNQIITATIVITAVSLLLYSLTFNLHDRVARSFSALLLAVSVVFLGDVVASLATEPQAAEVWLRLQWLGIAFLPPAYLHFSDALLETTGLPSRGRRRVAVRVGYLLAAGWFTLAVFTNLLVADPTIEAGTQHLAPGALFWVFTPMFALASAIAIINLGRSYRRCVTATTRRRMRYLTVASATLPLSVFPYILIIGGSPVLLHPFAFWLLSVTGNMAFATLLVVLAYAVAFFGTTQPDRVIKSRLFQWLLRGPFVASIVLGVLVLTSRATRLLGLEGSQAVALAIIATLLLLQFIITIVRVPLERLFFYGSGADRHDVRRLQLLEERLLTNGDARQLLESIVAAVCDLLQVPSAFVATVSADGARIEAHIGAESLATDGNELPIAIAGNENRDSLFKWGHWWVMPLHAQTEAQGLAQPGELMGILGMRAHPDGYDLSEEERDTLQSLADRAAAALEDRRLQINVFTALDSLLAQSDRLQQLRAAARYSTATMLQPDVRPPADLVQNVRDALSQYWGGPKLTSSPLLKLKVVEQYLNEHEGNAANALRAVLRDAIDRVKPEGARKFTAEWILYNILEMKFMQGRRVREVAMRLAMSEADLYRKQRVAIEQVAYAIAQMERENSPAGQPGDDDRSLDYSVAG